MDENEQEAPQSVPQFLNIRTNGETKVDLEKLVDLQEDLKFLTPQNRARLAHELKTLGLCEPITVSEIGKKIYILNGNQRVKVIREMIEAQEISYDGNGIPANFVECKNLKEAVHLTMALTSQYGTVDEKGYRKMLKRADMSEVEGQECFNFPEIDMNGKKKAKGKKVEFEAGKKKLRCPNCAFEGLAAEFKIPKEELEEDEHTEEGPAEEAKPKPKKKSKSKK